jgi:hypothetical protein
MGMTSQQVFFLEVTSQQFVGYRVAGSAEQIEGNRIGW